KAQVKQAQNYLQKNTAEMEAYRKVHLENYEGVAYREATPIDYLGKAFNDTVMNILYSNNTRERRRKETEWEMERKKRQHDKRDRGGRGM
ncbi:MAG: MobA/MobL family mobilization protein, partial [Enterococcus sp.]